MRFSQALTFFETQRSHYGIPDAAILDCLEKRIMEVERADDSATEKEYDDTLVWVCRYYEENIMRFYEMTSTMDGRVIRYDYSS
jgi:hypothetical protein